MDWSTTKDLWNTPKTLPQYYNCLIAWDGTKREWWSDSIPDFESIPDISTPVALGKVFVTGRINLSHCQ